MKKRLLYISISVIIIFMIINVIASLYFYHLAIDRNEKEFLQGNEDLEVSEEAMNVFLKGDWYDWRDQQSFEEMEITAFDRITLKGYYLEAEEKTNKTVVFAHGYLGHGMDMALFGQYYYEELGYNIFTADARGHGSSEGDYIGFGWHDRLDYLKWLDEVIDRVGEDAEIVLHGLSMGAATVLMTAGEDLPEQVNAVIADSPYTTVYDLFAYQMKRMFSLPAFPLLDATSITTKFKAGYSLKEASALEQVKQIDIPVLYIHGEADTFVPTSFSDELAKETKSKTERLTIEGANHGEGFVIEKELYLQKLKNFLKEYN